MAMMVINRKNTQYGANSGRVTMLAPSTGIYGKKVGGSKTNIIAVRRGRR